MKKLIILAAFTSLISSSIYPMGNKDVNIRLAEAKKMASNAEEEKNRLNIEVGNLKKQLEAILAEEARVEEIAQTEPGFFGRTLGKIKGATIATGNGIKNATIAASNGIKNATVTTANGVKNATAWTGKTIAGGDSRIFRIHDETHGQVPRDAKGIYAAFEGIGVAANEILAWWRNGLWDPLTHGHILNSQVAGKRAF
ncbi:MAG: hypothetical protein ABIF12_03070, partial [bacterium]